MTLNKNVIFVFSGTGNSLWAAKEIASAIGSCDIVTMGCTGSPALTQNYERIGFVYPTYAGGMPRQVKKFVTQLQLHGNTNSYFFAVATCGRISRAQNVITQMKNLLRHKGVPLHFGDRLDMFSNYVVGYEMRDSVKEEAEKSAEDILPMISNIQTKQTNSGNVHLTPRQLTSIAFMHVVPNMDKHFNINANCIGCGLCQKVCPMKNIQLDSRLKPVYLHNCEQCLACIQCCPKKAINYKNKTQNRQRYLHPHVSWNELSQLSEKGFYDPLK